MISDSRLRLAQHGAIFGSAIATACGLSACDGQNSAAVAREPAPASAAIVHPERWPLVPQPPIDDSAIAVRLDELLKSLTVEEKVGQIIQADINSVTPQDVRKYRLGSILSGGNSGPNGDDFASAQAWLALADEFYLASVDSKGDSSGDSRGANHAIPLLWGVDAVHGHNNIIGATLFPHNIGLGAARNPDLIRRIGEITAREVRVTGQEWTFAPTLAVVQDVRWGRSYESYSQNPQIVHEYAAAMITGLQGATDAADFLRNGHVIATAKHFIGDGGTFEGRDQGDNRASEEVLRDIHAAGYTAAISAGVQSAMASFSSWQGAKVHGHKGLLTDVLKGRLNFDGLLVGDWNAHGQVEGCSNVSCAASINAGVDLFMAPEDWRELYENTLAQVRSGQIPMARVDDAVRRILRVKLRAGLFAAGKPSTRPLAGQFDLLGSAEHRAVARQAARESLVLLKNSRQLLPLKPSLQVLVAGDGADNLAKQNGGWSITWQGTGVSNAQFPNAESIFSGIRTAVTAGGGHATLSPTGAYTKRPDVAIVVFGEEPYAEFHGDIDTLEYKPGNKADLALLRQLREAEIPVVSVFLSGRPMWVNPELNASDAFVAAWLPGSEGGAVADVLFARTDGAVRDDFKGKLPFSWPRTPYQVTGNLGTDPPLFAYDYGLRYADKGDLEILPEEVPQQRDSRASAHVFLSAGRLGTGWKLKVSEANEDRNELIVGVGETTNRTLKISAIDRHAQEDALLATWSGAGAATLAIRRNEPVDLQRETNGQMSLAFDYRVDAAPTAGVKLAVECKGEKCRGELPIEEQLRQVPLGQWQQSKILLSCFQKSGADMRAVTAPITISTSGSLRLGIANVRLDSGLKDAQTCE